MTNTNTVPETLSNYIEKHENLIRDKAETEIVMQCVNDFRNRIRNAGPKEKGLAIEMLQTLIKHPEKRGPYGVLLQELMRG